MIIIKYVLYNLASRSQLDENQIQNWLNHKFPHGFSDLERALERLDTKQFGTVKFFHIFFSAFLINSNAKSNQIILF